MLCNCNLLLVNFTVLKVVKAPAAFTYSYILLCTCIQWRMGDSVTEGRGVPQIALKKYKIENHLCIRNVK